MKKLCFLLVTATLLMFFSNKTNAQFHLGVGPALGFNFNLHTGSDLDEGGSGLGLVLAAQTDMTFTQDRSIGMIASLVFYDNRNGSATTLGSANGVNYSAENDVSISYFQIETLFKYRLPMGLYFVFGPEIGFDLSAELESTLTYPQYPTYSGEKQKSSLKNVNTRFELKMGAGYDIPISQLITLAPQLTFGYGVSDVIEDVDYSILTFQALVTCKFMLL